MTTLKDVEAYWSEYSLGLETLAKQGYSIAAFQNIKKNHDKAYAYANKLLDLPALKGKSVLELACGIGLDTIEFAKHGAQVTAIDISRTCIDIARKYLRHHNLRINFLVGNAEKLCLADATFDIVVARGILMYTLNPQKVIDEILRVLKPKGKAFVLLHNKYSWYVLLAKISGQNLYNTRRDPPINNLYLVREAVTLCKGFSALKVLQGRFPEKAHTRLGFSAASYNYLILPFLKMLPKRIMNPFGYYILVEATK